MSHRSAWRRIVAAGAVLTFAASTPVGAQYFGRNKVQYRTFAFEVMKTDRFDVYHYPEEIEAAGIVARMAERWHARLSRFLGHDLRGRQPIILYAVPAHFRQTNAIEGLIGEGTGGATEALKRRIALPMSGSLADTDHVLGHELVHAFQFDMTGEDPRESLASVPAILQFPLWFVEGMAEYLTLGPRDGQTAMWLRDAVLQEKLPHLRDLDRPEYFPYRWGHAFWAHVGARYGDRAVASLIRSAANPRVDLAGLARQLGTDPDELTADWHRAIRAAVRPVLEDLPPLASRPRRLLGRESGGGRFHIGPRLSPDGRLVAFFSERGQFSMELYIADAANGRVVRKLSESATDPHFDSLEFLRSAGAWSPDGRQIAIAAVRTGRSILATFDVQSGRLVNEWALEGLDDALHPSYAPDGASIVLSGNRGGVIDLYRLALESGALQPLTADPYADLEPVFTPDGSALIFVTERFGTDLHTLQSAPLRLARLDLDTLAVRAIGAFGRGKHLSPHVSPDGRSLTFVAEPDGVSNLYRMPIDGGPIVRLSSVATGVAGIAATSPALGVAASTGRMAFSVFDDGGHAIYVLDEPDAVLHVAPEPSSAGAMLVAPGAEAASDVQRLLVDAARGLPPVTARLSTVPYERGLSLDAVGQPVISAGVSEFGGYVSGSVSAFFSDMLGDRLLGLVGYVGGTVADVGGQVIYANRRHRWNWAAGVEQVPYRVGYLTIEDRPADSEVQVTEVIERQTARGGFVVASYPFSPSTRLELAATARTLSFTGDRRELTYAAGTGVLLRQQTLRTTLASPLHLAEGAVALVRDTSFFGATSPVFGSRARLEVGQSLGSLRYTNLLADWRRYFMPRRPVTLATRLVHFGRYGPDSDHQQLLGLYAGYPELIRGYGFASVTPAECRDGREITQCEPIDRLLGSRLVVANVEVRAPLVGLVTGEFDYGRVPVEIAAFVDAGLAWTARTRPSFAGGSRPLVRSVGLSARVNVFGLFVLDVSASRPLDRPRAGVEWQVGMRQGF